MIIIVIDAVCSFHCPGREVSGVRGLKVKLLFLAVARGVLTLGCSSDRKFRLSTLSNLVQGQGAVVDCCILVRNVFLFLSCKYYIHF